MTLLHKKKKKKRILDYIFWFEVFSQFWLIIILSFSINDNSYV